MNTEATNTDLQDAGAKSGRLATPPLLASVANKEQRKLQARREEGRGIWYGLGMFGLVGWSIAIPTVAGTAIGVWIDRTWKPDSSCTLMGLFLGVVVGCWIAWYWVQRESLWPSGSPQPPQQVSGARSSLAPRSSPRRPGRGAEMSEDD